jgi:methionyl-tRNA formyltransferase
MDFGIINSYILLGGGKLLFNIALEFQKKNLPLLVISSSRHLEEKITENSLKKCLEERKIEYIITEKINEDEKVIERIDQHTLGISIGAAWILRKTFIEKFGGKLINIHGTRLPQNRGGGNFSWQILSNNRLGFCLIHQLEEGIDTGPIIKYQEFFYPNSCRLPKDYISKYNENTEKFLMKFIDEVQIGKTFFEINQSEYFSTYWPRLSSKHHGFIDWNWNLQHIESFICAFDDPYDGVTTFINGKKIFLKKCFIDSNDGGFHPYQKGIIYKKSLDSLFIATENGTLIVSEIFDENNLDMFSQVSVGDRFYTPIEFLDKSKQFRAIYTDKGLKISK